MNSYYEDFHYALACDRFYNPTSWEDEDQELAEDLIIVDDSIEEDTMNRYSKEIQDLTEEELIELVKREDGIVALEAEFDEMSYCIKYYFEPEYA